MGVADGDSHDGHEARASRHLDAQHMNDVTSFVCERATSARAQRQTEHPEDTPQARWAILT